MLERPEKEAIDSIAGRCYPSGMAQVEAIQLYYDESGNTGTDLLNSDQPAFAIGSTSVLDDRAAEMLAPLRRQNQPEIKYRKLRSSRAGQRLVIQLLQSGALELANSKIYVVDKRFYLVSHLVDKLIEPTLHEAGIELYKNDGHVGLANVWYFAGHKIFPGRWSRLLEQFLVAVRRRDATSFQAFDDVLTDAFRHSASESRDFATGLFLARRRLPEFIGVYENGEVFDPAVDTFIGITQQWMGQLPGTFEILHDQSKPLKRSAHLLRALMARVAPRTIGFSGRQAEFPLRVSKLDFVDSKDSPSTQLADLLAGIGVDIALGFLNKSHDRDYFSALEEAGALRLMIAGMMPTLSVSADEKPRPGESSLVDGAAKFLEEVGYFGAT